MTTWRVSAASASANSAIKNVQLALELDQQRVAATVQGLAGRHLDPALAEAIFLDILALVVDVSAPFGRGDRYVFDLIKGARIPVFLVLNKIDGMKRTDLLPLVEKFRTQEIFEDIFLISALKGEAVPDVAAWVAARMPEGPWLYPEDQAADIPSRLLAAEVTREKIYLRLHDELPYASAVETEKWEERKDGSVRIDQVIYVERDSQKMIVLGKGGQTIKLIGQQARQEMERQFERRVHLFIFVKVRENWTKDPERLRMMGLDVKG